MKFQNDLQNDYGLAQKRLNIGLAYYISYFEPAIYFYWNNYKDHSIDSMGINILFTSYF